ncbi:MAG: transposase family protein, partial [bacterium]|nr:transposase family protein [bacterium]
MLIREILDAVERFGKPKTLRTDNEAVFTSIAFRGALFLLGIKLQLTLPGAPWQNGRIERFFGTFKERLRQREWLLPTGPELQGDLDIFRFWYNHARTHQHLDGRTPAMAWTGQNKPRKKARYFSAWESPGVDTLDRVALGVVGHGLGCQVRVGLERLAVQLVVLELSDVELAVG